jgi:hypothetical protein
MSQSKEEVVCGVHGPRPLAFACVHIAEGLLNGTTAGFVIAPEDPTEPYPLAWCDGCERRIGELGWRQWLDGASDFKMLCADCYLEARDLARAVGLYRRRLIRSG